MCAISGKQPSDYLALASSDKPCETMCGEAARVLGITPDEAESVFMTWDFLEPDERKRFLSLLEQSCKELRKELQRARLASALNHPIHDNQLADAQALLKERSFAFAGSGTKEVIRISAA